MPWAQLDDALYDHPKVEALPDRLRNSCIGLWVRAISWSNRHLTDGVVPRARLVKLDARPGEIDALIHVGLFDRLEDGVAIHDFLAFSPSAAAIRTLREQRREAGRIGGQRSAERRSNSEATGQATGEANPKQTASNADVGAARPLQPPNHNPNHNPSYERDSGGGSSSSRHGSRNRELTPIGEGLATPLRGDTTTSAGSRQ